jgi:GMP synthase-like glutamine amidotransferase
LKEEKMRLHYLQHVPFEDAANIEVWAKNKGYSISGTQLFDNEEPPEMNEFDWLIILGGPMNVYEEEKYPWLAEEKKFIREAIANGKIVLGICLGAQLIADVLGAKVYKNKYKEIGWFSVLLTPEAKNSALFKGLPSKFIAFHWHGDTFDIPPEAVKIAESEGCANQAFVCNERVIGLQFHLESSLESIKRLIENCSDEIVKERYVQTPEEMLSQHHNLPEIYNLLTLFLNNIEEKFG